MGCLFNLTKLLVYLGFALILGVVGYASLGGWFLVLILGIAVAVWSDAVRRASRPSEKLGYVLGRMGVVGNSFDRHSQPLPQSSGRSPMPSLPDHIAALRGDLPPILASLYHALHSPDSSRLEAVTGGLASRLSEYRTALTGVFDAAAALKAKVFDQPYCAAVARRDITARLAAALEELTRVYGAVFTLLAERPAEDRLIRLEHNLRANLECLAMFFADILLSVSDPERILLEGRAVGETRREIEHELRLRYPESLAELDTWADTPTGYDAGHVRAALSTARASLGGADTFDQAPKPVWVAKPAPLKPAPPPSVPNIDPAPRQAYGGGWLTSLVFGLILGDLLSDDDCDGDV